MAPKWFKDIPLFWPVVATGLGVVVTAASANTRLSDLTDRVDYIWNTGTPATAPLLARIDERQVQMNKTLERIDHKLDLMDVRAINDDTDARSRSRH